MAYLIVFALGYLLGGVTALVILGLTVAARRGDSGRAEPLGVPHGEESAAAWRERS